MHLSCASRLKLTATPTVANGDTVGQEVQLVNTGTKPITLQNGKVTGLQGATLAGSGLDLRSRVVALAPGCSVTLVWNGSVWVETARATYGGVETNVKDFGAVGDGVTDDYQAFRDAIDSFSAPGIAFGGRLIVPRGEYRLSQTLSIDKQIHMLGESGGANFPGSVLRPNGGVTGIMVERYSSSASGGPGDFSVFEHIAVHPLDKSGATAHCFHVKAQATFRSCMAWGASGDGFHIQGSLPLAPDLWHLDECFAQENDGHGYFFQGGDANAGVAHRCTATTNGGWGFYDSSFLGNTFVACHTDANVLGPYTCIQTTAQSLFLGCYSEGDQPPSVFSTNAMCIGGLHGAGLAGGVTEGGWSFFGRIARWMAFATTGASGAVDAEMFIGGAQNANEFLRFVTPEDAGEHSLFYGNTAVSSGYDGCFGWNWAHVAANAFHIGSAVGVDPSFRPLGAASMIFPNGFFLGNRGTAGQPSTGTRRMWLSSGVPTVGNWEQGDEIKNESPAAGGNVGWVCTTSGTFGTYSEGRTATSDGATNHIILSAASSILVPGVWVTIGGVSTRLHQMSPWRKVTGVQLNVHVTNGGNVYRVTSAGTTGSAGGPTGTGSAISDGTIVWAYVGPAATTRFCSIVPAGAAQAIAYSAPVFKTFGTIAS